MEKMRMESLDLIESNIEKIAQLFPGCITETIDEVKSTTEKKSYKKVVDFEALRQMLSRVVLEGEEAYEFTWVGKKAAMVEANRPIRKTLRPCAEKSKDWDTTKNLYIEGDNLDVLKLLQESYLNSVRLIYIDPPYNTGNDFVYADEYKISSESWDLEIGKFDETGNRFFRNTDSNGRFHSDWCSMMYSRLLLSRNLLSEDGAIFISIDDHEADNLKKICDEVFGAECFIANISWQRTYSTRNDSHGIVSEVEHIVAYSKLPDWSPNKLPRTESMDSIYKSPDNDPRAWTSSSVTAPGALTHQGMVYAIQHPFSGELMYPTAGRCWSLGQLQMLEYLQEWADYELRDINDADKRAQICGINEEDVRKEVKAIVLKCSLDEARENAQTVLDKGNWPYFYFTNGGKGGLRRKTYLDEMGGRLPTNFWTFEETGHTDEAKKEIKTLFQGEIPFDTPKPTRLLERIIEIGADKDSIVMDFFSGSATTAHAVFKRNLADGGKRKFIMVQLPEKVNSSSYNTLCDIGIERIKRAGDSLNAQISPDKQDIVDTGFRVLKLDESNMNDVYYSAGEYTQDLLSMLESNVKADRTDLDLLFGCLLEWGLPLSMPYTSEEIEGCKVHTYNEGDLIACFDENIPDSVVKEIAKRQPLRAVFRDSSFKGSPSKINVGEIFKMLAPDTRVKVI